MYIVSAVFYIKIKYPNHSQKEREKEKRMAGKLHIYMSMTRKEFIIFITRAYIPVDVWKVLRKVCTRKKRTRINSSGYSEIKNYSISLALCMSRIISELRNFMSQTVEKKSRLYHDFTYNLKKFEKVGTLRSTVKQNSPPLICEILRSK